MSGAPDDADDRRLAEHEETIPTVYAPAPRPTPAPPRGPVPPLAPRPTPPPARAPLPLPHRPTPLPPRPVAPALQPLAAWEEAARTQADERPAATVDAPAPLLTPTDERATFVGEGALPELPASQVTKVIGGRYEVEATLGEGGMGAVYRVYDRELRRRAALKMIRVEKRDEKREKRFQLEARAMAKLSHPACVQVFDMGVGADGTPFIVMEIVEGEALLDLIDREPLSPRRAALVLHTIAGALHCVHQAGLIHRDVKPHNILVGAQGSKLADFGIVKDEEAETVLTAAGAMIGTLAYMSPEQTARTGQRVDPRADVYSLGATLYHCLVGKPPFGGPQPVVLHAIQYEAPRPPRSFNPEVPEDLQAICLKCLAKDREERYASAGELAEDLARFLADEPVLARPPRITEKLGRALRRHRLLAFAVFAAWSVAVAAVGALLFARHSVVSAEAAQKLAQGDSLLDAGKPAEAEAAYLAAARLDPSRADDAFARAHGAQVERVAATALETLGRVRKLLAKGSGADPPGLELTAEARSEVHAEVERAATHAEQALRDALALEPGRAAAEKLREAAATALDALAELDPVAAERLAQVADDLGKAHGLAALSPGTVSIATSPPAAHVRLYRYDLDPATRLERPRAVSRDGRGAASTFPVAGSAGPFELVPGEDLGSSPSLTLPPGDYLALVEAEGQFPARVPFSVWRRRKLALKVTLPARQPLGAWADELVFVAGGEARSGPDLERVETTPDFFMQRREVTNARWREFLEDVNRADDRIPTRGATPPLDPRGGDAAKAFTDAWWNAARSEFTNAARRRPDAPVTGVTEGQANQLALSLCRAPATRLDPAEWNVRLPTQAEFHRALRGPLRRAFPWGNVADAQLLAKDRPEDESPAGVCGLAGGVPELSSDHDPESRGVVVLGGAEGDLGPAALAAVTTVRGLQRAGANEPAGLRLVVVHR